jgi:hypothetical protein
LNTLRGTILEEHLKLKAGSSSKSLAHKDLISTLIPELNLANFQVAESKIAEKLIELDEQYVSAGDKDTPMEKGGGG